MAFPTSNDTYTAVAGTTLLSSADHANQHNVDGSTRIALGDKIGLGAGSAAANQILVGSGAGASSWGSVWNLAQLGTPTIGTPSITGGTITASVVGTNSIVGGTLTLPQVKTYTLGSAAFAGTNSTTQNLDLLTATRFLLTFPNTAGSITLTTSNANANQLFLFEALQGTAGNGTVNWFAGITWFNNGTAVPTQGTTPSRKITYVFLATSTSTYDGFVAGRGEA